MSTTGGLRQSLSASGPLDTPSAAHGHSQSARATAVSSMLLLLATQGRRWTAIHGGDVATGHTPTPSHFPANLRAVGGEGGGGGWVWGGSMAG